MEKIKYKDRKLSLYISGGVILICIIIYFIFLRPQQLYYEANHVKISGTYLIRPISIDEFKLTDHRGKDFTKDNLKNHWSIVFFGFTHCELICPVTLSALNQMYTSLENRVPIKYLPQIVFITVDPERDNLDRLHSYLHSFNKQFIGCRAAKDKTVGLEKKFHISETQKQADSSQANQYVMNHDTKILLLNPNAEIQAYFLYPPNPKLLARDYYAIINKYSH